MTNKKSRILCTLLLISCANVFVSCDLFDLSKTLSGVEPITGPTEEPGDGTGSNELPYIPMFSGAQTAKGRAITYDETTNIAEFACDISLPEITGFGENDTHIEIGESFSTTLLGEPVNVETSLDESTGDILYTYDLGANTGKIIISLHEDRSFDYEEYLLFDFTALSDMIYDYLFISSSLHADTIFSDDEGNPCFSAEGWGYTAELRTTDDETWIEGELQEIGIRVASKDGIEIGHIDMKNIIPEQQSTIHETLIDDHFDQLAIDDMIDRMPFLKGLSYARVGDLPDNFCDYYYLIKEDTYYPYLASGYCASIPFFNIIYDAGPGIDYIDTRDPEGFAQLTGYTFADFGCSESADIFQFVSEFLGLECQSIPGTWNTVTIEGRQYQELDLSVETSGVYFYNKVGDIYQEGVHIDQYGSHAELESGKTYTLRREMSSGNVYIPEYLYLVRL